MWTWEARRLHIELRGPFVGLKEPSFGIRNSCVVLKGSCVGLRGPSYGLPAKWASFQIERAICRCVRACAALRRLLVGLGGPECS